MTDFADLTAATAPQDTDQFAIARGDGTLRIPMNVTYRVQTRSPRGAATAADLGKVIIDGPNAYIAHVVAEPATENTAAWTRQLVGAVVTGASRFRGVFYDEAVAPDPATDSSVQIGDLVWVTRTNSWHELNEQNIGGHTFHTWRPIPSPEGVTTIGHVANEAEGTRRATGNGQYAEWGGSMYRSGSFVAGMAGTTRHDWELLTTHFRWTDLVRVLRDAPDDVGVDQQFPASLVPAPAGSLIDASYGAPRADASLQGRIAVDDVGNLWVQDFEYVGGTPTFRTENVSERRSNFLVLDLNDDNIKRGVFNSVGEISWGVEIASFPTNVTTLHGLAYDVRNDRLYAVDHNTNALYRFSGGSWTNVAALSVINAVPRAVAVSTNGGIVYVAQNANQQIRLWNGSSWTTAIAYPTGMTNLGGMVVLRSGNILVSTGFVTAGASQFAEYDMTSNAWSDRDDLTDAVFVAGGSLGGLAEDDYDRIVVVYDRTGGTEDLYRYDGTSWTLLQNLASVAGQPRGLAMVPRADFLGEAVTDDAADAMADGGSPGIGEWYFNISTFRFRQFIGGYWQDREISDFEPNARFLGVVDGDRFATRIANLDTSGNSYYYSAADARLGLAGLNGLRRYRTWTRSGGNGRWIWKPLSPPYGSVEYTRLQNLSTTEENAAQINIGGPFVVDNGQQFLPIAADAERVWGSRNYAPALIAGTVYGSDFENEVQDADPVERVPSNADGTMYHPLPNRIATGGYMFAFGVDEGFLWRADTWPERLLICFEFTPRVWPAVNQRVVLIDSSHWQLWIRNDGRLYFEFAADDLDISILPAATIPPLNEPTRIALYIEQSHLDSQGRQRYTVAGASSRDVHDPRVVDDQLPSVAPEPIFSFGTPYKATDPAAFYGDMKNIVIAVPGADINTSGAFGLRQIANTTNPLYFFLERGDQHARNDGIPHGATYNRPYSALAAGAVSDQALVVPGSVFGGESLDFVEVEISQVDPSAALEDIEIIRRVGTTQFLEGGVGDDGRTRVFDASGFANAGSSNAQLELLFRNNGATPITSFRVDAQGYVSRETGVPVYALTPGSYYATEGRYYWFDDNRHFAVEDIEFGALGVSAAQTITIPIMNPTSEIVVHDETTVEGTDSRPGDYIWWGWSGDEGDWVRHAGFAAARPSNASPASAIRFVKRSSAQAGKAGGVYVPWHESTPRSFQYIRFWPRQGARF